ncbi:MAG: vWA domain-containing protein [Vicinamibacterales bacterium]
MFSRLFATRLFTAAGLVAALSAPAAAQDAQAREGRVHISVTDRDGKVLPLTAAEVAISEDGRAREVLRVEKASGPVQIALLLDDSQAAQATINDLREGVRQFIAKVLDANAQSEIALISFGERPTLLVDYTSNRAQLERGIGRIFARQGAGAYMLEAIFSAARGAAKRASARGHIAVIGTEGVEFSNDHYGRVLDELAQSGATLWALTLTAGARAAESEETRNRSVVLGRGTDDTGGRQDQVLANSAIPTILGKLADSILNQYAVTYGRPDALVPPKTIDVKVSKPGARVLAPSIAPRVRKP